MSTNNTRDGIVTLTLADATVEPMYTTNRNFRAFVSLLNKITTESQASGVLHTPGDGFHVMISQANAILRSMDEGACIEWLRRYGGNAFIGEDRLTS